METHSKFKARLGIFVMAGVALFVIAIFYIGRQKHLFNPIFKISSMFRNISGLEIGNNVRFSGINVGTVDNIKIINDTTVVVDVIIDKDVQQFIKTDCYFTIGSEGLIGDRIINITQGSSNSETVKEGQFLKSVEPVETDAILTSLKVTGENAEVISDQLAQILYKINSGKGTFGMLINDSTMATNINTTIHNLKSSSKGLDENLEAAKHNILFRGYFKKKQKEREERDAQKEKNKQGKTSDTEETEKEKKGKFTDRLFKRNKNKQQEK
jgi:phospholipid/cholesterol/gamma-HCH transport system substrate-binding protein